MVEEKLLDELLSNKRNFVKLGIDTVSIVLGVIFALLARFESSWLSNARKEYIFIYGSFFLMFYLFKRDGIKSWSFTNSLDVLNLLLTHLLTIITVVVYMSSLKIDYSRGIVVLIGIFAMILQLSGRFVFRLNKSYKIPKKHLDISKENIVVYGAGEMGANLVRESKINRDFQYNIRGFVDDDSKKRGIYVNGIKVLGNIDELEEILEKKRVKGLIIAISDIDKESIKNIVERCRQQNIKVKII